MKSYILALVLTVITAVSLINSVVYWQRSKYWRKQYDAVKSQPPMLIDGNGNVWGWTGTPAPTQEDIGKQIDAIRARQKGCFDSTSPSLLPRRKSQ